MFSFDFLHNCDRQFYMPVQLGANALLAPLPHISAVIMYRGPGRPRVGVSALSSVLASPSTMLLHPSFFKKTGTERGSVPHFPTRHSPDCLSSSHTFFSIQASPACLTGPPPFTISFQLSSPYLGKASYQCSSKWDPMFTFSSVPTTRRCFEEQGNNLMLYLGGKEGVF